MPKRLLLCLIVLLLVCTSCAGQPEAVNIMCYDYQEGMFRLIYNEETAHGHTLAPVAFHSLEMEDYTDYVEWHDAIFTGLLTGRDDMDIFLLNSTDDRAYKALKDHYYVDLSQDTELMEYFDAMYPQIREWCIFGSEIFGFPISVSHPMGILASEKRIQSVGYTMEDIMTMDGLVGFCHAWREHNPTPPTSGTLYTRYYCDNYLMTHYDRDTGELDLGTPAFRTLMDQCREYMMDQDLPFDHDLSTYTVEMDKPLAFYTDDPFVVRENHIPGSYPLIEGEAPGTMRYAEVTYLVINPASKNKEQAFEYMRLAAEAVKYHSWGDMLYRDKEFYKSFLLTKGRVTRDNCYSEEQFEIAGRFLEDAYVGYGFPGFSDVSRVLYRYIYGRDQTLDETIAEAQDLLDTIRQEQYIGE
mgnify:CR=1 FL=1